LGSFRDDLFFGFFRGFRFGFETGLAEFVQLADAFFVGTLEGGFVALQFEEALGAVTIVHESGTAVLALGVTLFLGELGIDVDDDGDAFAVDLGVDGAGAMKTPLVVGDAQDEVLFGFTDRAEALVVIGDEGGVGCRVLVEEEVLFGA
jgi:hypothetical protein